jgi:hypothetical protein
MGQHEVVVGLKEPQRLAQSVFALTRRGAASPQRRYLLTQTPIEPLHKGRVDLPAAGSQDLLHRHFRAEHHAVFDLHEAPPSYGFDHLRLQQLGPWHPAWLGRRASGLAPRQLHPVPIVGQQRRHVRAKAIGEKERGAVGSQDLHDLVDHALRHRERALSDVDRQQQLALGVHGHPDPLG